MSSAEFYDNFISYQVQSGINDRIFGLYKRLCRTGLSTDSNVLEIGCGIGTLTYLLLKKIRTGKIESVDISPKSIAFAQQHLKAANLTFHTADILGFEPQYKLFDRILLFDVLEHIPLEQHQQVFQRISRWMNDESLLLINIPNPAYILFDQKNNPAALQETDQPVYIAPLSAALASASIDIVSVETYSVWVKEDYQFIVLRKRRPFEEKLLSTKRNLFQKGILWIKRRWRKLRYPYPSKQ
ncbi:MAG: class I SAM-dependent methyltransferase [Bacteroidota bacterium]